MIKKYITYSGRDEYHPKSPNGTSFSFIGEYFLKFTEVVYWLMQLLIITISFFFLSNF